MQYLYGYFFQLADGGAKELAESRVLGGLVAEIKKIKEAHVQILRLLLEWRHLDVAEAAVAVPPRVCHLGDNSVLQGLAAHPLWEGLQRRYPSWWGKSEVELGYYESVHKTVAAKGNGGGGGLEEAVALARVAFKQPAIQEVLKQHDLLWADNKLLVRRLVVATLTALADPGGGEEAFAVHTRTPLSKEQAFYEQLVGLTLSHSEAYEETLAARLQGWRVERLFALDRLLIKMLLSEAYYMPEVPTSVAINEYLELAKLYSGEQSAAFIHGVADAMLKGGKPQV